MGDHALWVEPTVFPVSGSVCELGWGDLWCYIICTDTDLSCLYHLCSFLQATREVRKWIPNQSQQALSSRMPCIHLDPTGTATIGSPKGSEGAGCQEAIHFPTTGQIKTVSESRVGRGREGRGGEGRGGERR